MLILEVEMFKVFALVMVRVGGLMVSAPVLGSRSFPRIGKIGLTCLIAMILTPSVMEVTSTLPTGYVEFAFLSIGELMIGLMMGFVMTLVFAAIQVGGQIMDMQTGFGMMNVFNPAMETQFPIFGFFYFILAILFLLAKDLHHVMIRALVSTFDKIPLGGFVFRPELFFEVGTWGSAMFYDGLLIAAPVAGAMMLTYISMGLMGRVVPQIHLFVIGFPITIAIGITVVAFASLFYLEYLDTMFYHMFQNVKVLINGMA